MATILVVEDEQMILDLITMVLEPKGHTIVHTQDGDKAMEIAKESKPDLVLLDVMLPGLDGFSVQNQLYEDEKLKRVPVIMMTAKSQLEDVFKTSPNVAGFIAKPFSVKDLLEKVSAVLKR
ncbi:MAG: response regulator [Elusimicrobia bacterium]|nr:response regulator [Elusimicrobiota bacterium]